MTNNDLQTLDRKLKIEQLKPKKNSDELEGYAVSAPIVATVL